MAAAGPRARGAGGGLGGFPSRRSRRAAFSMSKRGRHIGNPFLLAVLEEDRRISVNALARAAGAGRVEMAPAEALRAVLGVEPGSVTPFGLVNAAPGSVRTAIDAALLRDHEWVHFHPLVNSMTTAIRPADLLRALETFGHHAAVLEPPANGTG